MKIHEYQAKALLARYGVPVPRGEVALSVKEAGAAASRIGGSVVVKAQIHAGGRGKGGGVKVAKNAEEAAEIAQKILGMTLVTHQTGPEGRVVHRVLIEETLPIERELYLGIVLDRARGKNVFMASADGGVEIEEVAAKTPERILKEPMEPGLGLTPFQARKLAFGIGIPGAVGEPGGAGDDGAGPRERSTGRVAGRNQSFHPDQGRQGLRARRQDESGRQRPVPPQGSAGAARSERGRSPGSGSLALRADLHQARRQRRLPGERRGTGHGHHGYREVRGRQSGEFSGCRRRRQRRTDPQRLPHPAFRQIREGRADQRFLRNSARRYRGAGRGGGSQRDDPDDSHRGPHGRHQRRAGAKDPERIGTQNHRCRRHARCGRESGSGSEQQ